MDGRIDRWTGRLDEWVGASFITAGYGMLPQDLHLHGYTPPSIMTSVARVVAS